MSVATEELIRFFEAAATEILAKWQGEISHPGTLDGKHESPVLAYCDKDGPGVVRAIEESNAKLIILKRSILNADELFSENRILVGCERPRLMFIQAVDEFWPEIGRSRCVDGPSSIHESAQVSCDSDIGAGVVIGAGCTVGPGCELQSGVKLYRGTRIGREVRIDANAVIGSPGFGFARDDSGNWVRFPQMAGVVIEDYVEIGAATCIDRGAMRDTVIRRGTKIDNLVYIAHNTVIDRNCLIMAHVSIAGSCRIEEGVVISPGANIRNGHVVGRRAHVGMGAVVVKDVAPYTVVSGAPAKMIRKGTYEG